MLQNYFSKFRVALLLVFLSVAIGDVWGEATYRLEQVTSVGAGMYVFEQSGHVMSNRITSKSLQTTADYQTSGLTGTEAYVWTLVKASTGYYMKNTNDTGLYPYLGSSSSDTEVNLVKTSSEAGYWTFNFQSNGTVIIRNEGNRFLGYTSKSSYLYKAYANSNLSTYPHAIKVYKLVAEIFPPEINAEDVSLVNDAVGG